MSEIPTMKFPSPVSLAKCFVVAVGAAFFYFLAIPILLLLLIPAAILNIRGD